MIRAAGLCVALACSAALGQLESWNDTPTRASIVSFVESVTDEGSAGFVPEAERIAVFDNDGCLWAEQPVYSQAIFAIDRVRALAADHPEWAEAEPYKSAIAGDLEAVSAAGKDAVLKMLFEAHAGVTEEEFRAIVSDWLATSRHPETGRPYTEMVYQPMLELLEYLGENGFKVFIVSGGGRDFLRVFSEEVYGIPRERVVGSSLGARFEVREGVPVVVKTAEVDLIDDKEGKPVGIYRHIGRRPIFAAGNSDGDLQMLQYTTIPRDEQDTSPRFGLIVHHTDAEREWAYDRDSHVGRLDKALDEAAERGWVVVDMARDWTEVFAPSE